MENNTNNLQQSKENDMFLSLLANPTYGTSDFMMEGFTAENTDIKSFDKYKDNKKVRDLFKDSEGNVNEDAMKRAYNMSVMMYNDMSNLETEEIIKRDIEYDPDSFVRPFDAETKDINEMTKIIEFGKDVPYYNPDRRRMNLTAIGESREGMWTPQELAQMHKRYNPRTGKFEESPEEWFKTDILGMFDTTVMATYGKDDPEVLRGEKQVGEYKLNEDGSYYTEFLNGRDTYDKEIVSRFDLLTKEDSWLHRYDFFDSAGRDKNVIGSIVRSTVEVAPMLIKSVSPYYIAASVAMQASKFASSMYKWFDSDSEIANSVDGFVSSFDMGTSEYSKKNALTLENLLSMGVDVWKQLKEQRWVFKNAGALIGKPNRSEGDLYKMFQKQYRSKGYEQETMFRYLDDVSKGRNVPDLGTVMHLDEAAYIKGAMEQYINSQNKFGSELGRLYMTAITSSDMWNQAKQENASDAEATFLMLGYMLGEYAIMRSNLGEMVMPELRAENKMVQKYVRLASGATDEFVSNGSTDMAKRKYVSKLLDYGKKIFDGSYHGNKDTIAALGANALGEGFEETAEELWADISKVMANTVNDMFFNGTKYKTFDNIGERYGMSFLGGVMGGGLFNATETFNAFKGMQDVDTPEAAYQQLVSMFKNGQGKKVREITSKMTFYDKNLTSSNSLGVDDSYGFAPRKKGEKSLDDEAKERLFKVYDSIETILKENALDVPDESVLRRNTLDMLKYYSLSNSITSSSFLQNANTATVNLVRAVNDKKRYITDILTNGKGGNITDEDIRTFKATKDFNKEQLNEIAKYDQRIEEARIEAQNYVNGMKADEYTDKMLFELTDNLNMSFRNSTLNNFIQAKYNKKPKELSETEMANAINEFAKFRASHGKDYLDMSYRVFQNALRKSNGILARDSQEWYEQQSRINAVKDTINMISKRYDLIESLAEDENKFYHFAESLSSNNLILSPGGEMIGINTFIDDSERLAFNSKISKEIQKFGIDVVDGDIKSALNKLAPEDRRVVHTNMRSYMAQISADYLYNTVLEFSKQKYINPTLKAEIMKMVTTFNDLVRRTGTDKNIKSFIESLLDNDAISDNVDLYERIFPITEDSEMSNIEKSRKIIEVIDSYRKSEEEREEEDRRNGKEDKRTPEQIAIDENNKAKMDSIVETFLDYLEEAPTKEFEDKAKEINELAATIQSKDNTPIGSFLDSFDISINGKKASDVINNIEKKFNEYHGNISEFSLSQEDIDDIIQISLLSEHARDIVAAYRTDNLSYGNLFGYAAMKNKLFEKKEGYVPLEIIDGRYAELLDFEIKSMIDRINSYVKISDMNTKNLLAKDFKIDARRQALFYSSVKDTVIPVLESIGVDSEEIKNAINSELANNIKDAIESKSFDFNDDQKSENMKWFKSMRKAIYNTFKNMSKEQVESFASKMKFASQMDMSFGSESTAFSNSSIYWQIASMASIDPDLVDSIMKRSYANGKIAPVSNQTMATYLTISYLLGGDKIKEFALARQTAINNQINEFISNIDNIDLSEMNDSEIFNNPKKLIDFLEKSPEGRNIIDVCESYIEINMYPMVRDILLHRKNTKYSCEKNYDKKIRFIVQNSKYYTKFPSIAMIEGIPGSGKTYGVTASTLASVTIKRDNGEYALKGIENLFDNVMVVTNEANMDGMTKLVKDGVGSDFADNVHSMTHDDFIKHAFGNSFDSQIKDGKLNIYTGDGSSTDGKTYVDSSDGDYLIKYGYSDTFDNTDKIPSLIIIDEATLLNYSKLKAINDIADKYNIKVIAIGDSEQVNDVIDANGVYDINGNIKITPALDSGYPVPIEMNSFITAPKMGESMRYDNHQHKVNVNNVRQDIYSIKYAIDDTGFYGDAWFDSFQSNRKDAEEIIDKMFATLDKSKHEKVMIIGDSSNPLNKGLIDYMLSKGYIELDKDGRIIGNTNKNVEHYDDAISFETAMKSQGREASYVIYMNGTDTDPKVSNKSNMKRSIYTGMSRSKRGTIMLEDEFKFNSVTKDVRPIISTYDEKAIKEFTDKYVSLMDSVDGGSDIPEYTYTGRKKPEPSSSSSGSGSSVPTPTARKYFMMFPHAMNNGIVEQELFYANGGLFEQSKKTRKGVVRVTDGNGNIVPENDSDDSYSSTTLDDEIDAANNSKNDDYTKSFSYGYTSTMYESGNYFYASRDSSTDTGYVSCIDGVNDSLNGIVNLCYIVLNDEARKKLVTHGDKMTNKGNAFLDKITRKDNDGRSIPFKFIRLNIDGSDVYNVGFDEYMEQSKLLLNKLHTYILSGNVDAIKKSIVDFVNNVFNKKYVNKNALSNLISSIKFDTGIKFMQNNPNNVNFEVESNLSPFFIDNNNKVMFESQVGRDSKYESNIITKKVVTRISFDVNGEKMSFIEIPTIVLNNVITMFNNPNTYVKFKEQFKDAYDALSEELFTKDSDGKIKINKMNYSDASKIFSEIEKKFIPSSAANTEAYKEYETLKNMSLMYCWQSLAYHKLDDFGDYDTTTEYIISEDKGIDEYYGIDTLSFSPELTDLHVISDENCSVSRVMIAKSSNNIFGVEAGVPFVLRSPIAGLDTNDILSMYIDIANGKNIHNAEGVTVLRIRMPKVKPQTFMKKMYRILRGEFKSKASEFEKRVGNDATVFSLLKVLIGSDAAMNSIKSYVSPETYEHIESMVKGSAVKYNGNDIIIFDAFKKMIDSYTNKDGDIEYNSLIKDIKENKDGIRNTINSIFFRLYTNSIPLSSSTDVSINEKYMNEISGYLASIGFGGINTSVMPVGDVANIDNVMFLTTNENPYGITDEEGNNHNFLVYAKIDKPIVNLSKEQTDKIVSCMDNASKLNNADNHNDYNKDQFSFDRYNNAVSKTQPNTDDNLDDDKKIPLYENIIGNDDYLRGIIDEVLKANNLDIYTTDINDRNHSSIIYSIVEKIADDGRLLYYNTESSCYSWIQVDDGVKDVFKDFVYNKTISTMAFLIYGISLSSEYEFNGEKYNVIIEKNGTMPQVSITKVDNEPESDMNSDEDGNGENAIDTFVDRFINKKEVDINEIINKISGGNFDKDFIDLVTDLINNAKYESGKITIRNEYLLNNVEMINNGILYSDEMDILRNYVENNNDLNDNAYLLAKFVTNLNQEDDESISCITI